MQSRICAERQQDTLRAAGQPGRQLKYQSAASHLLYSMQYAMTHRLTPCKLAIFTMTLIWITKGALVATTAQCSQYNSMHGNARDGADAEAKSPQLADGNGVHHPAMAVSEPTYYGV
jgi:hypothetical protein